MSDAPATAARRARLRRVRRRCCAPTVSPSRPSRPPRSSQRSTLLGPRGLDDIRRAGLATLAPPPERRAAYDMLFRHPFPRRRRASGEPRATDEEVVRLQEEGRGEDEPPLADESNESGEMAVRAEALVERRFGAGGPSEALRRLAREAPRRLPRRRGHRRMRARRGPWADLRRTLRESAAPRRRGPAAARGSSAGARPRKMLLLIDVSGSMKARTEDNLRLAHALRAGAPTGSKSSPSARASRG